jgi:hypothetical protein
VLANHGITTEQTLAVHLLPVFGKLVLAGVSPKLLAAYKIQRRLEQAAPATINKELQLVRHAFNLAMREWNGAEKIPCIESRWRKYAMK